MGVAKASEAMRDRTLTTRQCQERRSKRDAGRVGARGRRSRIRMIGQAKFCARLGGSRVRVSHPCRIPVTTKCPLYEITSLRCGRTKVVLLGNRRVVADAITGCKHDRSTQGGLNEVSFAGYSLLRDWIATHATIWIDVRQTRSVDCGWPGNGQQLAA